MERSTPPPSFSCVREGRSCSVHKRTPLKMLKKRATTTVVKRGIYTVSGMYNGTLRAVVIFVDAKIHYLLQISKYCQNFFHIE